MTPKAIAQDVEESYWEVFRLTTQGKTHSQILEMSKEYWEACYHELMPEIVQNAPGLAPYVSFAGFYEWATNPKE